MVPVEFAAMDGAVADNFGSRFRAWRETNFRSRAACAAGLGLDEATVKAIETGVTGNGTPYIYGAWIGYLMVGYHAAHRRMPGYPANPLEQDVIADMVTDVVNGMAAAEAALKYGVTGTAVSYHVRKAGYAHVLRSRRGSHSRGLSKGVDLEKAAKLINEGATLASVALELGCDRSSLRYHQRRGDLPLSPRQIKLGVVLPKGFDRS